MIVSSDHDLHLMTLTDQLDLDILKTHPFQNTNKYKYNSYTIAPPSVQSDRWHITEVS